MTVKRIGYACKYIHPDSGLDAKSKQAIEKKYNTSGTTLTWMQRQSRSAAEQRLSEIIQHNLNSVKLQLNYLKGQPIELRLLRISSDILPFYTHPYFAGFYAAQDNRAWFEREFDKIGDLARNSTTLLSFHPGQFTVLASDNLDVLKRSIEEFEYHADMIRWMGYGKVKGDFKCNVHVAGKQGPAGIRETYHKLSTEARNSITVENDEFGWGLESCLELADIIPVVVDIHHHYIRSRGEYLTPSDDRVKKALDSWHNRRPVIHYSVSREEYFERVDRNQLPDINVLLESGVALQKLRAHSDGYSNRACNDWALSFIDYADIMCEAKNKNLAALELYNQWKSKSA